MKSEDYYNKIAKGYNELYGREQMNKWHIAKKMIPLSKEDVVLDLGSGTGIILPELSKMVRYVFAVDSSISMLTKSPKLENVKYIQADAEKLPFPDKHIDKTISLSMMQDVDDWDKVLREIKRVTRGYVLISMIKRNKDLNNVKEKLSKYFNIQKFVEEEKDFIFLLL